MIITNILKHCLYKEMLKSVPQHTVTSPRGSLHQFVRQMSLKHSVKEARQKMPPSAFPERRGKVKSSQQTDAHVTSDHPLKLKEHRLDIGDENCDLLGYEVYSGKLFLDNKNKSTTADEQIGSRIGNSDSIDAKLSSKALAWGSHVLHVGDVISVSLASFSFSGKGSLLLLVEIPLFFFITNFDSLLADFIYWLFSPFYCSCIPSQKEILWFFLFWETPKISKRLLFCSI